MEMKELMKVFLSDPESVNKIITELGPKALDNAEHVVISGIETSGRVLECLVKDGKIVEHSAKTVQEAVKSTENVALSIVETGGKVCEYLIKDGKIVQHTAETIQLGVKTTGDVAKELIDKGADTINTAIQTSGTVVSNAVFDMFSYKTAKETEKTERNRDNNMTKQEAIRKTGDVLGMKILVDGKVKTIEWDSLVEMCKAAIDSGNPEAAVKMLSLKYQSDAEQAKLKNEETKKKWGSLKTMVEVAVPLAASVLTLSPAPLIIGTASWGIKLKIPNLKKGSEENKEEVLKLMQKAYDLNSKLNTDFPASQFPELRPIKRLLDASVKKNDPKLIAETIQVIQEEINDMQNMDYIVVERIG